MGGAENKIELAKMGIEIILFLKFTEKMLLYQPFILKQPKLTKC